MAAPSATSGHARLDHFSAVLVDHFQKAIDRHDVTTGTVALRFVLPEDRRQVITLLVERDARDREWLVIRSEIGTVTTFEETVRALELNRGLRSGVLYLDEWRVLQIEHRSLLDEVDDASVVQAVRDVAGWADEFEAELFLIDVR